MAKQNRFAALDDAIDKLGLGRILDKAAGFVFGEPVPSDGLRFKGHTKSISGYLPYRGYDEESRVFENLASVGICIEFAPLMGADERIEKILAGLFDEGFPDDCFVQINTYASPYVGNTLEEWTYPRTKVGGVVDNMARYRAEHMRRMIWNSGSKGGPFYLREYRTFISVSLPKNDIEKQVIELQTIADRIMATLKTLGLPSKKLTAGELISLVRGWMNMGRETRNATPLYDTGRYICDQCVAAETSYLVYKERIKAQSTTFGVRDYTHGDINARALYETTQDIRTYSVTRFPSHCSQAMMASLLGDFTQDPLRLMGSWWSSLCLYYQSAETSRKTALMRSQRAARQFKSPFRKMFPQMEWKAEEWIDTNARVQDGARLVQMGFNIMVQTPENSGTEAERALRSLYRSRGFELERNDCVHMPVMLSTLPMGYGDNFENDLSRLKLSRTSLTSVAKALAPMQGQPRGDRIPHIMLLTRFGQPVQYSQFQNHGNGNHNMAVAGTSGSGKSVFMQEIAWTGYALGHQIFVIDDGRSFKNLCHLDGGNHAEFRADRAVSVNPFSMINEDSTQDDEEMLESLNFIVLVVVAMARGEENASKEELGLINQAVKSVWEKHGRKGDVTKVQSWLNAFAEENDEGRARDLATAMKPFCDGGTYESFFKGEATLEMSSGFNVFEMSDLETKKDLRGVVIFCMMFMISAAMRQGGRQKNYTLIIDEAWALLCGGAACEFIEGFSRRCRKYGGSLITGTQSFNDFYKSDGGRAAFENSDWRVALRLKSDEIDQLQKSQRMSLSDAQIAVMKTLKISPGEYSELFVMGPGTSFVGRLVLDPYSIIALSSSADVFAEILQRTELGIPLSEAIEDMAYPQRRTA